MANKEIQLKSGSDNLYPCLSYSVGSIGDLKFRKVGHIVIVNGFVSGLSLTNGQNTIGTVPAGIPKPTDYVRTMCNFGINAYSFNKIAYLTIDNVSGAVSVHLKEGESGTAFYVSVCYVAETNV